MQGSKDQFYQTAPSRILEKAAIYSSNLRHFHQLPEGASKSLVVRKQAQFQRDDIEFAIKQSKYQLDLYRKKEQEDIKMRTNYDNKWKATVEKVQKNEQEIIKKKEKKFQDYNKHLTTTYKRYQDEERRHRQNEKQQALKLRKDLQEFYEKEAERKKQAELKQVQVGTQYQKAIERLNKIQHQNEEFAFKAEEELYKELNRNNHANEVITARRRAVSSFNNEKSKMYEKKMSLFDEKESRFIQKYGQNEDGSLKAWKHIENDQEKTKKRLSEFFKKRVERWATQKKRVDAAKAETPQKCLEKLDKTSKSEFRKTMSSFHNSFIQHEDIVRKNKSLIKERDERKKEEILETHLDVTLKNHSSYKVAEKMQSMRHHARRLADSYL